MTVFFRERVIRVHHRGEVIVDKEKTGMTG
jgi:hypothetical protein